MDCPICGSDEVEILNSKQKSSKKKIMEEYLLKCESCGHVFKDMFSAKKPEPYRKKTHARKHLIHGQREKEWKKERNMKDYE